MCLMFAKSCIFKPTNNRRRIERYFEMKVWSKSRENVTKTETDILKSIAVV